VEVKPRKGKKKRINEDDETHKIVSIVSTQEEEKQKIGCRIRMLVGHDVDGKLNATIITTKKEVDYQFWYPKRNKVINEYKHIRDYYSWDDDFEMDGESAKGTYSPKVYDLRTPQKKPEVINMMCDISSDEAVMDMNVPSKRAAKRNMIGESIKATTPKTLVQTCSSTPVRKYLDCGLNTTGRIFSSKTIQTRFSYKAKKLHFNLSKEFGFEENYTLLFPKQR